MHRASFLLVLFSLLVSGCSSAPATPQAALPSPVEQQTSAAPTEPPAAPTATSSPAPENTPTPAATLEPSATPSPSPTAAPSETSTPTNTPTATSAPATPSGEDAIYIYLIQPETGGPVACGDSLISINTGLWRTGDVESDVRTSLERLFVKQQWIAGLYNPAYLSNIQVDSVKFKAFQGILSIRLSGTYVRSGDRCDDRRVREQVWNTIRQFSGIKTIDILLNGNLLGDILAGGQ
jgi:hypothetical protein